jgi:hypothetical protein
MLITIQSLKERRIAIYREGGGGEGKDDGRILIDGRVSRPCSLVFLLARLFP